MDSGYFARCIIELLSGSRKQNHYCIVPNNDWGVTLHSVFDCKGI